MILPRTTQGGKVEEWRDGERMRTRGNLHGAAAAVCSADRESLLGFAVDNFFFLPQAKAFDSFIISFGDEDRPGDLHVNDARGH